MNSNFNDILIKIKKSKTSSIQRNFLTKVMHRSKLVTAQILSNVVARICIFLFVADNKYQNSFRGLLKRKIWQIFCKFFDKQNEGYHLVKSKEDQIYYLLSSKEKSISEEIFATGNYDKRYFDQTLNLFPFDKIKNKNNIFFDVGANSGTFTLLAAKSGYFNKIVSIEPHLETFNILRINLLLNNIDFNSDSIKLYNLAIDPIKKNIDFEICEHTSGDNRVRLDNNLNNKDLYSENKRKTELISCEKLQTIVEEVSGDKIGKLCWFWIDVQGAEMRVLQSLQDEIIQNSVFVLEVWEYGLERLGNSIEEIGLILKNHYAFNLNFDHPKYRFDAIDAKDISKYLKNTGIECCDILFIPKSLLD